MTTARIRPDAIKRNLARGALLEKQSVVRIKEKHGECSVKEAGLCVESVGIVLGGMTSDAICGRDEDDVVVAHKLLLCLVGVPGTTAGLVWWYERGRGHDMDSWRGVGPCRCV